MIQEQDNNYHDVDPRRLNVYRSSLTVDEEPEEGEEFQTKVSAFMKQSKPLRALKKIGDSSIGEYEILLVELPHTLFLP
jgi:hypothetical protein